MSLHLHILPGSRSKLMSGFHLLIINPTEIPPHIALLYKGQYFDISVNGVKQQLPIHRTRFWQSTPFLAIELDLKTSISQLSQAFSKYTGVSQSVSCLAPIKELMQASVKKDLSHVTFVYQLIPELQACKKIKNYKGFNLGSDTQSIIITHYSKDDVVNRITQLKTS